MKSHRVKNTIRGGIFGSDVVLLRPVFRKNARRRSELRVLSDKIELVTTN